MAMTNASRPNVSIQRTSIVVPATPSDRQSIFLTNFDIVIAAHSGYINRIFFYGQRKEEDYAAVLESLKRSLETVLAPFFPLAGRLAQDEEDGKLVIDCSDAGVEFLEAVAHVPFNELQRDGFQYRQLFCELASRTELMRSDYTHLPITSIQVTEFPGEGLAVGVSISHAVVDNQSFYDFVRAWAEVCRGVPLSLPPRHMRRAAKGRSPDGLLAATRPLQEEDIPRPHKDLVGKVFGVSAEALQRWKAQANSKEAAESRGPFTTFESVLAHWCRAVVRARELPDECPVEVTICINGRGRFLSLPTSYFGNCLAPAIVKSKAGELCGGEVGAVAGKIHEAIVGTKEEDMAMWMREQEMVMRQIRRVEKDHTGSVSVVDSPEFPIYDTDFGWGRPQAVRGEWPKHGEVQFTQGRQGAGSMDVMCCGLPECLERLECDPELLLPGCPC